jgi:16S rRNA C967 or C1407 C5-methylase (RsmB/RsmF family)/NOL1/NOP2/fmu family ribosome biogenesis protein
MFPPKFIERLNQQEHIDVVKLLEALDKPSPVSIRINKEKWDKVPVNSLKVPWSENGYYLDSRPSFTSDPLFHSGCYYPQEASSMFLEQAYHQLVDNSENIRVLDLCGAPGGKSTHLSSLIDENGFLVANDVIRTRAVILSENITKWGIGNTVVTNNDPSAFSKLKGYFDLILIDAPCSGEGMFSDTAVRSEWSVDNASLCADRQRRIVMDVWPSLKASGFMVYSTCTFNPVENEENIKWFTEQTGAYSIPLDISKYNGIQEINYKGITGYGFYPGKIRGEGLFISVIKKPDFSVEHTRYSFKKSTNQLTNNDIKIAGGLIKTPLNHLYRNNDNIYALALPADEFLYLKNNLRIIKGGTALIKTRIDGYTPLHDLALSLKMRKNAFSSIELDYHQSVNFLKRENLILKNSEPGWILLKYEGVNLGFAKNVGSRLNNYFPIEWRIRLSETSLSSVRKVEWLNG